MEADPCFAFKTGNIEHIAAILRNQPVHQENACAEIHKPMGQWRPNEAQRAMIRTRLLLKS